MTLPLDGLYIQVATPSLDGKYGSGYMTALMNTKTTLEHFGAVFDWVNFPGCSDLPHARAKILANFTDHAQATHLMLIDADMAWEPADVVRFINSNRDFVAGVGCKKKLPLEWCVGNFSEEDGHLEPAIFKKTGEQIVGYPKSVGTGFVMISKQCALRMRQAYPELKYTDQHDKKSVWALYDPIITVNGDFRMRQFDDFAFCHRWRKIGGVVAVFPDIHLKHEGNYTFEGSSMDSEDVKNWKDMFNEATTQAQSL